MKIFVTGATGFIGGHLVRSLKEQGHEVTCLDRRKNDITDENIDFQGAEVVYHLAGILGKFGVPEEKYWQVNFEGTKNILNLAKKAGVGKFIHVSTGGAADPKTVYEKSKAKAEALVLGKKDEIDVVVIRPEFVYGPGDEHVLGLFKAVRRPFPLFDGGQARLYPTYIDDVTSCLIGSLNNKRSGEVVLAAGERIVSVRELAELMAQAQGRKLRPIYVPKKLALAGAAVSEILFNNPPITKSMIDFFSEDKVMKNKKGVDEMNLKPIDLEEGIKKTVNWYEENDLL